MKPWASCFVHQAALCWFQGQQASVSRYWEGQAMDDYQEELLEYQAYELDPLEPAEDATEL
jgi:hypothetical protein